MAFRVILVANAGHPISFDKCKKMPVSSDAQRKGHEQRVLFILSVHDSKYQSLLAWAKRNAGVGDEIPTASQSEMKVSAVRARSTFDRRL